MLHIDLVPSYSSRDAEDNNSRIVFIYTLDNGKKLPLMLSENVGKKMGFEVYPPDGIPPADRAPHYLRFEPRRVHAQSLNGKIKRSFPVGRPDFPLYCLGGKITIPRLGKTAGVDLFVTGTTGEQKTFATGVNTQQTSGTPDGTVIQNQGVNNG